MKGKGESSKTRSRRYFRRDKICRENFTRDFAQDAARKIPKIQEETRGTRRRGERVSENSRSSPPSRWRSADGHRGHRVISLEEERGEEPEGERRAWSASQDSPRLLACIYGQLTTTFLFAGVRPPAVTYIDITMIFGQ